MVGLDNPPIWVRLSLKIAGLSSYFQIINITGINQTKTQREVEGLKEHIMYVKNKNINQTKTQKRDNHVYKSAIADSSCKSIVPSP